MYDKLHAIDLHCTQIDRCASELVQRKLFSESPDRFGLVQFGAERASNPLDYPHVALMERGLAVADWQVGKFVVPLCLHDRSGIIKVRHTSSSFISFPISSIMTNSLVHILVESVRLSAPIIYFSCASS